MQLIAYLTFNGQCKQAFEFYARCLGGKIEALMPHAGTPAEQHVPPEWRDKIIHARLSAGGATLMGSDAQPEHYQPVKGSSVALQVKEPAEAERLFQALSENEKISMPIQQTFWSARFGMFTDQFGVPWMVNCDQSA